MTIPPPPWAVRQYFNRRRPANLGRGFTAAEVAFNDSLWLEICRQASPHRPSDEIVVGVATAVDPEMVPAKWPENAAADGQGTREPGADALTPGQKKEAIRRRARGATLQELAHSYNVSRATRLRLVLSEALLPAEQRPYGAVQHAAATVPSHHYLVSFAVRAPYAPERATLVALDHLRPLLPGVGGLVSLLP